MVIATYFNTNTLKHTPHIYMYYIIMTVISLSSARRNNVAETVCTIKYLYCSKLTTKAFTPICILNLDVEYLYEMPEILKLSNISLL